MGKEYTVGTQMESWNGGTSQSLTFIVTEDCNLRCKYCYITHKSSNKRMSFDVAKKFIDYAGGLHLNSFTRCFICSVFVQTLVLLISKQCTILLPIAWVIIFCGSVLIWEIAPVENINRELDTDEKAHCKKVTVKVLSGIIVFALACTLCGMDNMVSLISVTILVVLISQCIGIEKYKIEKKRRK